MLLRGKKVLVTGGSGTIGKAIAMGFVQQGAEVVLAARHVDTLRNACHSIHEHHSDHHSNIDNKERSNIHFEQCDITNENSVVGMFERLGFVDILINSVGINPPGSAVDVSIEDFDKALQVNVKGPFLCSREAMKLMKKIDRIERRSQGGRIINIGSLASISPRPDSCAYTTSKFALLGLSKSLALDGRSHGISVGIIHPGNVVSELLSKEDIQKRKETEGFMEAKDVADCVLAMAAMPPSTNVMEMTVLPTGQPFVGRG